MFMSTILTSKALLHNRKGVVTIPKSVTPDRIRHNTAIFDFELRVEDIKRIGSLDQYNRMEEDQDDCHFLGHDFLFEICYLSINITKQLNF